jgi:hypothetical protein
VTAFRFLVCALLAAGAPASAKTDLDYTWSDGPVRFVTNVENAPAGSGDPAALRRAVRDAAMRWNAVIGRPFFQLRFDGGTHGATANGRNEIFFAPALAGGPFFAAVAIERKGLLRVESDVQLNPSHAWFAYRGPLWHTDAGERIPDLYRVMLHELGHIMGMRHAEPETAPSVMRARMSDIDDFTRGDLRDAREAVAWLFRQNAPRIVWPARVRQTVSSPTIVLRGRGRPFFVRVAKVRIFSAAAGMRTRRLLVSPVWRRALRLDAGRNRLHFSYRVPNLWLAPFATRIIHVR